MYAAERGHTDTVRLLLQYKADIHKFGGCLDDENKPEYVILHLPPLPSKCYFQVHNARDVPGGQLRS
jgi:hypothetical protein